MIARLDQCCVEDQELAAAMRKMLGLTGIDLHCYRSQQVRRRLNIAMARSNARNFNDYCRIIQEQPSRLQEFKEFFSIGVSQFFRNLSHFDYLKREVLPDLTRSNPNLKIWSAGCSYGAEPYSVAILMEETALDCYHPILATDIARGALERGRAGGIYTGNDLRNVNLPTLRKYFIRTGTGYTVINRLRQKVEFRAHNLLADPFGSDFDLILCRNVGIFLIEKARNDLYRKLWTALKRNGILFLGSTEIIVSAREMGFENLSPSFYRKMG